MEGEIGTDSGEGEWRLVFPRTFQKIKVRNIGDGRGDGLREQGRGVDPLEIGQKVRTSL